MTFRLQGGNHVQNILFTDVNNWHVRIRVPQLLCRRILKQWIWLVKALREESVQDFSFILLQHCIVMIEGRNMIGTIFQGVHYLPNFWGSSASLERLLKNADLDDLISSTTLFLICLYFIQVCVLCAILNFQYKQSLRLMAHMILLWIQGKWPGTFV